MIGRSKEMKYLKHSTEFSWIHTFPVLCSVWVGGIILILAGHIILYWFWFSTKITIVTMAQGRLRSSIQNTVDGIQGVAEQLLAGKDPRREHSFVGK